MQVRYILDKEVIHGSINNDNPYFILSNKKGGFLYLPTNEVTSRYQGLYYAKSLASGFELFKVIESISIDKPVQSICNNFYNIERHSGDTYEKFFLNHSNSFVYSVHNYTGVVRIFLDCRKMHDYDDKGRIYDFFEENGNMLIEYKKFKDSGLKDIDYKVYIAIKGIGKHIKENKWIKRHYSLDEKRGSVPYELFVYNALIMAVDGELELEIAYSDTKEGALKTLAHISEHKEYLMKSQEKIASSLYSTSLEIPSEHAKLAYMCSLKALDDLLVEIGQFRGLYAGIPWFYQFWARDEAISLNALILQERYGDVRSILLKYLRNFLPDGRISNRFPKSELGSADSTGWVFKRWFDLIRALDDKKIFHQNMEVHELNYIKEKLRHSLNQQLKTYIDNGLVKNRRLETWMDTNFGEDYREGFRIEIQALQLAMYRFMRLLCKVTKDDKYYTYGELEELAKAKVRKLFFKDSFLSDGIGDDTIRPNIFLAYYIYPALLSKREWGKCFDTALKKLWLDWGGFSTIDKSSPLFRPNYTGENNASYHRGDSWYFLNNMAAICMHRVDPAKYKNYVLKILEASTRDILSCGAIGHHSEVSSASVQTADGSLSQAWSSAMYIELVHELYKG